MGKIPEKMTAKVFDLAARLDAKQDATDSSAELQQAAGVFTELRLEVDL